MLIFKDDKHFSRLEGLKLVSSTEVVDDIVSFSEKPFQTGEACKESPKDKNSILLWIRRLI